ncbi:MAG: cytochrome P450 [Parasphingopyxis sp.]|uniref:cytochrome P450 n=1 Tax=Parasphingopyxis sp. TaxID=1920299 RepID=UPI0032EE0412
MAGDAAPERFSVHDPAQMQQPYAFYDDLRKKGCPVGHSEQLGGFFFTTTFEAAQKVYQDFRTFSSADGTALPKQPMSLYPIDLDPPHQAKMRKVLNPLFLQDTVQVHKARMEEVINAQIDEFIGEGKAELQEDLVRPVLATIILPFLGVPMSDRPEIAFKIDFLTRRRAEEPEQCATYGAELNEYLMNLVEERRAGEPRDDIFQVLLDAEIDGRPLTDSEILGTATLILFGGLDTTSSALGEALWYLIREPDEARKLMDGEYNWYTALHEFVRYASPIQGLRRTVTRDTVLEGCPLKAGDFVMAMNAAGNHDPNKFEEPDRVILDRPISNEHDHLGFGGGAHICLGQHFARLLMEVLIRAVLTRLEDIEIEEGFEPVYAVGESRVLKQLPVTFKSRESSNAA